MRSSLLRCLVLAAPLFLVACGQYSAVKPGPQTVAGSYKVSPTSSWSRRSASGVEIWTVDGEGLQTIIFLTGVGDGDPFFPDGRGKTYPKFKASMTPSDIAEAFADSVLVEGGSDPRVQGLRPQTINGGDGFRFEFTFVGATGLEYQGSAVGAVIDKELRLVYYAGTRLHYYERHRKEFERIADQIGFT